MEKEKEMFKMKKFIPIVGLLIVGLMILSGCSTKEKYEGSIPITVDNGWSISSTEKDTKVVEPTQVYNCNFFLKDNTVFITIENSNKNYQVLKVMNTTYVIEPLSTQTIEVSIPEDFKYEVEYIGGELFGKGKLTDFIIDRAHTVSRDITEHISYSYSNEAEVYQNEELNTSSFVKDALYLSCKFSMDKESKIIPQDIQLSPDDEVVFGGAAEYILSFKKEVVRDGYSKVMSWDEETSK